MALAGNAAETNVLLSIGIVGAGIGGLTLALACRDNGFKEITVYEQADDVGAFGAGIQLSPNATRVLRALKLREALQEHVFYPLAVHFRTAKTGFIVAQRPLGKFSEDRYGAPYYHIHRADLHQVLFDAAIDAEIDIQVAKSCTDVEPKDGTIAFNDGTSARHDVVVGCDGIHSAVRAAIIGPDAPRFTGHVAWRGMVPVERLPDRLITPTATVWMGPRKHFVHYYVRGGTLVNFVGIVENSSWKEESWRILGDKRELAVEFADWHPSLATLIDNADDCFKWALYDRDPMSMWSLGRATLLGDACHPMLPYMAQGAAMAIEDAWVLSRMLEHYEEAVGDAFTEYERYRRPRTARIQTGSRSQGRDFHLADGWSIIKRNLRLGFGTRFLPEIAMQQLDWVHGYDCIRGFD